jgi:TetR/AcrR family transcriptional regulator, transcriptional repressor for nem operon
MEAERSTKTKLLEAGQRLMLSGGYTATTLDQICAEAGVTKGSFFHYFKSKDDFGVELLDHYWTTTQQLVQAAAPGQSADPLDRVHEYLDVFVGVARDPAVPKSCLFGNLSQEIAPVHAGLRARCAEGFESWAEQVARDLEAAKQVHPPQVDFDSRALAEHFIAIFEGSLILAKAKGDARVLEDNVEHFRRYVTALFGTGGKDDGQAAS